MSVVSFSRPTHGQLAHIARNMRRLDVEEVAAATGKSPIEAVTQGVTLSKMSSVGMIDGEPVAVFGVAVRDILALTGSPWMLGTDMLTKRSRILLSYSRTVVDEMLGVSPHLVNYVHAANKPSIRWLTWLGFKIEKPVPWGIRGELFHRFSMGEI